ncbi:MAG TPA: citrate/2-methylcitrate synthase [Thermoanaerobaculia bacterium]|nr:citrate/2-methylcitrate synthase [Thermoanaerobaculia bacterium]
MPADDPYLTAPAAAALLGVTLPTLYAYVSRGLLASEPAPGTTRARRYRREEVERLCARRELRQHPEEAAPRALAWGEPVLDSALTLIDGTRLFYRGRDAIELSRGLRVEEVAALLWTGDEAAAGSLFPRGAGRGEASLLATLRGRRLSPVERLQALLPLAAAADGAAWDLRPEGVTRCGARILRLATAAIAGRAPHREGIAATLAAAWRLDGKVRRGARDPRPALSAALVLSADHELNVSTFAARCVASAAATPWDAVAAGLAALKGARHGGQAHRMQALLREAAATSPTDAVADWLRRGESLPGFGHRLYPAGDPRGAELLAVAGRVAARTADLAPVRALAAAVQEVTGDPPNVDLGLAALAAALRLPAGGAQALFALGRTIGWVAHAIEEYGRGRLIRPRARYVGPPPATPAAHPGPG